RDEGGEARADPLVDRVRIDRVVVAADRVLVGLGAIARVRALAVEAVGVIGAHLDDLVRAVEHAVVVRGAMVVAPRADEATAVVVLASAAAGIGARILVGRRTEAARVLRAPARRERAHQGDHHACSPHAPTSAQDSQAYAVTVSARNLL